MMSETDVFTPTERTIWTHMRDQHTLDHVLAELPAEHHDWATAVWHRLDNSLRHALQAIEHQYTSLRCMTAPGEPDSAYRRRFADNVVTINADPLVWQLFDGKSIRELVLTRLKPLDTPPPNV